MPFTEEDARAHLPALTAMCKALQEFALAIQPPPISVDDHFGFMAMTCLDAQTLHMRSLLAL